MWLEQVLSDAKPTGLRMVTVDEFFGPNRVDGEQYDEFSAALGTAAEGFALVGAPVVVAACTVSRDELARSRAGGLGAIRAFTRAERAIPQSARALSTFLLRPAPCAGNS
jgi:hypothetical protein